MSSRWEFVLWLFYSVSFWGPGHVWTNVLSINLLLQNSITTAAWSQTKGACSQVSKLRHDHREIRKDKVPERNMSGAVLLHSCTHLEVERWLSQSLFLIALCRSFFHKPGCLESVEFQRLIMIYVKIMHPLLLLSCLPDILISSCTVRNNEWPFPVYLHHIICDFMYHCYTLEPSISWAGVLVI